MHRPLSPALLAAAVATLAAAACSSAAGNPPGNASPAPGQRGPGGPRAAGPLPPTFETRGVAPARAELRDVDGRVVGTATFTQGAHGVVLVAELSGLAAGVHAMHIHDVGRCEPPFTTAGAHYNPGLRAHGIKNRNGYHAGDLPNFSAPATGSVRVDALTQDFTLGPGPTTLFDLDGSSIMIHSGADDYESDPGGNAGTRVACGVITRATPSGS